MHRCHMPIWTEIRFLTYAPGVVPVLLVVKLRLPSSVCEVAFSSAVVGGKPLYVPGFFFKLLQLMNELN